MRRVAITGLGALTALGPSARDTWSGLLAGSCGIRPVTRFDTSAFRAGTGAALREEPRPARLSQRLARRLSRSDLAALQASEEALAAAGLEIGREDPRRVGVFLGACSSGLFEAEEYWLQREGKGLRRARLWRPDGRKGEQA